MACGFISCRGEPYGTVTHRGQHGRPDQWVYRINKDTYKIAIDTNGDKSCGAAEAVFANAFKGWTPALSKAALNFQLSQNDPGSWAHNFDYTAELLYDSTQDLGGDVSKLRRP